MGSEVVKYNNDMNTLRFKDFTQKDYDFLMCICARMRDLGEKKIQIEYDYIMELVGWDRKQKIKIFEEDLLRMSKKLLGVSGTFQDDEGFKVFNLFSVFSCEYKKRLLTVQVNPEFKYILNDITKNFTRFELKEYVGLDSKYAKTIYVQIRQRYKLKGHFWSPSIEELRDLLDIPDKYPVKEITRLIIHPSVEVLRSCKGLSDLQVEVIKERRRGNPVKGYKFTWTQSDQIKGQSDVYEGLEEMKKYKSQKEKEKKKRSSWDIETSPSYINKSNSDLEKMFTDNL